MSCCSIVAPWVTRKHPFLPTPPPILQKVHIQIPCQRVFIITGRCAFEASIWTRSSDAVVCLSISKQGRYFHIFYQKAHPKSMWEDSPATISAVQATLLTCEESVGCFVPIQSRTSLQVTFHTHLSISRGHCHTEGRQIRDGFRCPNDPVAFDILERVPGPGFLHPSRLQCRTSSLRRKIAKSSPSTENRHSNPQPAILLEGYEVTH